MKIKNKNVIPKSLKNISNKKKIILECRGLETFFVYLFVKLYMVLFGRAKMIRFCGQYQTSMNEFDTHEYWVKFYFHFFYHLSHICIFNILDNVNFTHYHFITLIQSYFSLSSRYIIKL